MDFLINYGLFLLKLVSVAVIIVLIFLAVFGIVAQAKSKTKGRLVVKKLNEKYDNYKDTLSQVLHSKKEFKIHLKSEKKEKKIKEKSGDKKRIFVLDFHGDIRASAVSALREEITALLTLANPIDEILLRLDSGGGLVNAYGLAAAQLKRITDAQIPLVIAIDKIAASGGYMMACVGTRIMASPFAIIGSIGVLAQLPNFHRYLQKKSIDFEQLTAGEFKRTLTVFGENTEKGREKMQQDIDDTHALFKSFIAENRPILDIQKVATGEHWYGTQAMPLKLIDELKTSDDYLLAASKNYNIFEVHYKTRQTLGQRLTQGSARVFQKLLGSDYQTGGKDYL